MLKPGTLEEFRQWLLEYQSQGIACMLIPHHIGYKTGYRGINWNSFSEDISPVVEIVSMHGCAECDDSPLSYLHTMGPLTSMNTMQAGLAAGKHFGVTGSTDHLTGDKIELSFAMNEHPLGSRVPLCLKDLYIEFIC